MTTSATAQQQQQRCVASRAKATAVSLSCRKAVAPPSRFVHSSPSYAAAKRNDSRAIASTVVRALVDPENDVILVYGCRERVAQCCVDQLSQNERSAGVQVRATLPAAAFQGVKNPLNAMSKELLYPDRPMIDCLSALDAVECLDVSGKEYQAALSNATGVILASESAPNLLQDVEEFLAAVRAGKAPKLKRVVVLSHIGVERRDVDPWKVMNRKLMVGTGVIGGKPRPGGAPLDRWWDAEEAVRAAAAAETNGQDLGWTYTIVRVGDLRGNGPTSVTYGDAMLTLVDNAFDVRMQDIEIEEGDCFEGFTKRQSAAAVMNRMLTTQSFRVLNKEFSVISTGPVDRERRKGWDVARGKSPPPISDKTVDEELQPKEDEETAPRGAPAPVPT